MHAVHDLLLIFRVFHEFLDFAVLPVIFKGLLDDVWSVNLPLGKQTVALVEASDLLGLLYLLLTDRHLVDTQSFVARNVDVVKNAYPFDIRVVDYQTDVFLLLGWLEVHQASVGILQNQVLLFFAVELLHGLEVLSKLEWIDCVLLEHFSNFVAPVLNLILRQEAVSLANFVEIVVIARFKLAFVFFELFLNETFDFLVLYLFIFICAESVVLHLFLKPQLVQELINSDHLVKLAPGCVDQRTRVAFREICRYRVLGDKLIELAIVHRHSEVPHNAYLSCFVANEAIAVCISLPPVTIVNLHSSEDPLKHDFLRFIRQVEICLENALSQQLCLPLELVSKHCHLHLVVVVWHLQHVDQLLVVYFRKWLLLH